MRERALSFLSCVNFLLLLVIPSLPRNPLERNKNITRRWRSKAFPFPHGVSPVSVPLIALQQGIHGKPRWAGTLSVSQSGAFSDCVTRFRGGALRHAKFPKTSYKVQLFDTRLHGRCVFREPAKGEPFVGKGTTEHILPDAQNFVRLKYVSVGTSGRGRGLIFLSIKVLVPFKQNAGVLSGEGHPRTPTRWLPLGGKLRFAGMRGKPTKFFRSIYCFILLSML